MAAPNGLKVHQVMPARLACVDRFCTRLRRALDRAGWKHRLFAIELVVRELLNNAVIHGSREDPRLRVKCNLTIAGGSLIVRDAVDLAALDPGSFRPGHCHCS